MASSMSHRPYSYFPLPTSTRLFAIQIGRMIPFDLLLANVGHRCVLPPWILHDCAIRIPFGMRLLLGTILGEPDEVREPLA